MVGKKTKLKLADLPVHKKRFRQEIELWLYTPQVSASSISD